MGILIDHESPQMTLHASQETLRKKALSPILLGVRLIGQRGRLDNLAPSMDWRSLIQNRRKLIRVQRNLTHVQSSLTLDLPNLALERHNLTRVQPRHNMHLPEGSKEHKANKADQPIAESMPAATASPFADQPNEAPAYQEPLENQPSWYDPNRAEKSTTPRATLDTSLENPRWYSRNENDVYVGARHSFGGSRGQGTQSTRYAGENSYGSRSSSFANRGLSFSASGRTRSKLPFFIGGGIVVLILLIVLIVNVVNALATPQQPTQEETLPVAESAPTQTSFTISFAGDCTLGTDSSFDPSTSFTAMYNDVDDPAYFMKNVASIFGSDDYTVVNMEGTLTESDSRQDKTYAFKGPAEYTEILKSGNIEAASLANNHSRDYGEQSYTDTIEALDAAGITNFGYDRIAYADVKGVKVALIGTYMLAEGLDIKDEMTANINTAKSEGAQVIIVFTHWGVKKETVPEADQVELGHAAIDAGATIVVGSHPHVIQGYEKYNGRYIVYSLGNFCFGGNKNPSDKDCMIFQQTFTVTGNDVATDDAINVIPCSISSSSSSNNYQPTPAEGEEADRIKAKIEKSNESIAALSAQVSGSSQANSSGSDAGNTDEANA